MLFPLIWCWCKVINITYSNIACLSSHSHWHLMHFRGWFSLENRFVWRPRIKWGPLGHRNIQHDVWNVFQNMGWCYTTYSLNGPHTHAAILISFTWRSVVPDQIEGSHLIYQQHSQSFSQLSQMLILLDMDVFRHSAQVDVVLGHFHLFNLFVLRSEEHADDNEWRHVLRPSTNSWMKVSQQRETDVEHSPFSHNRAMMCLER